MFVALLLHEFISLSHWLLQILHTWTNVCWHLYNLFSVESVVKLYYNEKSKLYIVLVLHLRKFLEGNHGTLLEKFNNFVTTWLFY